MTAMSGIQERGPWRVGAEFTEGPGTQPEIFIESNDFTHDVRLYVIGDFRNTAERQAYAEEIAGRLNHNLTSRPPVTHSS